MTAAAQLVRARRILTFLHAALATVPVLFLVAALVNAALIGFQPASRNFPRAEFDLDNQAPDVLKFWSGPDRPLRSAVVAVWGLSEGPGERPTAESPGIHLARELAAGGAEVRVSDPAMLAAARVLLGGSVRYVEDPFEAARGATQLLVAGDWPEFRELGVVDFERLRREMQGQAVLDVFATLDGGAVEAAGLQYFLSGVPQYPPWLDPELQAFTAETRALLEAQDLAVEDVRILVVPILPMGTWSPRSRWYLQLNYYLAPARVYLPHAQLASGTIPQFWDWVRRIDEEGPAEGPLWPEDYLLAVLEDLDVDFVLFFLQNDDFRRNDWILRRADGSIPEPPR
ncbi:MAG TPA: UDP-glucose/GDP-mannose dehydrogenase family protein [Planctomycetota bacterium]